MLKNLVLFISCPKGLEYLLGDELTGLGCHVSKIHPAGVDVNTDQAGLCRICLWSRIANRVLLPLAETRTANRDGLYRMARSILWENYLEAGQGYWIAAFGQAGSVKHSGFGAQVINDAVKDHFREQGLPPPVIDQNQAKQSLQLSIGRTITLSLDLSGRSLHQRGYRQDGETAPLKENLAAAILIRAGWPELCASVNGNTLSAPADGVTCCLVDPMCGSGTLIIEGAMMAMDVAPGLTNPQFAFLQAGWVDQAVYRQELGEAQRRAVLGKRKWQGTILGTDVNPAVIRSARRNSARSGLDHWIEFRKADATALQPPLTQSAVQVASAKIVDGGTAEVADKEHPNVTGLVVCNPPYGERLGQELALRALYQNLGRQLKSAFGGWHAAVFTASKFLAKELGMRAEKEYKLFNGKLPATLYLFTVFAKNRVSGSDSGKSSVVRRDADRQRVFSSHAQMLANRIIKNRKHLLRWVRREHLEAYRLYDADIPEYAVAIDCYQDFVCIQEYAPPKQIDEEKARQRMLDVLEVVAKELSVPEHHIFVKQRKRQKGNEQYQRYQRQQKEVVIDEYGCQLMVNLSDFLDTGLFLDHRPVRKYIQDHARGKHFLNLFCYTATASVHAAVGGAASTTSVDLSNTYLEWARKNFSLNGLLQENQKQNKSRHFQYQFVRGDALQWLAKCRQKFDIIFLDPPTFSNSKSMVAELDIQRDHGHLIEAAMNKLVIGGELIFSTNFRRFRLDSKLADRFNVLDRTDFSLPLDFSRKRIHQCWFIRHKTQESESRG